MILLLLMSTVQTFAFDIPKPTSLFYVNDKADLLSDEIEEYIVSTNVDLCEKTDAQIVVVTINSLNGDSLEEYATALFREYGIGDKDKNNGVLLLVALEDRKSRIEVGYGLEGALNDAKTGRIQDNYMIPYFKEGNYAEGLKNGFDAILAEVAAEYDVEITRDEPVRLAPTESAKESDDNSNDANTYAMFAMGVALVLGLIVGAIGGNGVISFIICFFGSIAISAVYGSSYGFGMGCLVLFGCLIASLIGYAITADIDTDGYSGGYGGGSSSSRSSSSSSSSSSSRSYSGGGGRSGGGGSSRSW